ncbi:hypothetical protein SMGD1_2774 [Sulfurimonas gotlandica GD1]|jgi:hypothetical protein|uniref:Uncharacterized protein n=1 Tax=Sulfurimonas gotlandica (strain DSM 19862 / JCM 16533 / GD1) TaxID=929558 RepID=B6BJP9_SULGG|nr:hypothetical protein [Sulfurimonas gotlandica]EDZ62543.1 hypothetical protein CBGD1_2110 [Sulfurimonas gotlandica GD1]EHP31296.1 hypothetical protein SMGD1_2774 [Sulfurimonas gotlandica GD1]
MYRTQEEKQKYIDKIFKDKALFEWEVLHVSSHYDRLEIMQILAQTLVRDKLKYEINFLYLESYDDFKFTQIVNIIFHEIANEWISFATDILYYPKKEAIEELQGKERVKFIHSLAKSYYEKYKRQIFEEIADTFIELVSNVKQDKDATKLIQETLQSNLIKNRQILEMHNFSQLFTRIKSAQNIKNSDITTAKMKVVEMKKKYANPNIDADEKQKYYSLLEKSNKELTKLKHQGLDKFDPGIKRLKDTMVQSMIGMSHLS